MIPTHAQPPANPADMLLSGVPPPQSPATAGLRPPGPPTGHSTGTADADRTDVAGDGQLRQSFAATLDRVAQPPALARSPDAAGRTPFDHWLAGLEPEVAAKFDALAILTPTAGLPVDTMLPKGPLRVVDGITAGVNGQPAAVVSSAPGHAAAIPAAAIPAAGTPAAGAPTSATPTSATPAGATVGVASELPAGQVPTVPNTGTLVAGDLRQVDTPAAAVVIDTADTAFTRNSAAARSGAGANDGVRDALRGCTDRRFGCT